MLAGTSFRTSRNRNLWLLDTRQPVFMSLERGGAPGPPYRRAVVVQTLFSQHASVFSPDGRWLAYASDESHRREVYVQRFPEMDRWQRVSTAGGDEPVWSRDGRELFYRDGESMLAVPVDVRRRFVAGPPRVLFRDEYVRGDAEAGYDVTVDGRRFLMIRADGVAAPKSLRRVRFHPPRFR